MLRSLSLALSIVASLVGCSTPGAFFGAVDGPAFGAPPRAAGRPAPRRHAPGLAGGFVASPITGPFAPERHA
ncbi:hypothetical protein I5I66_21530 [Pseudomonas aeruginosa]|nr:hypothetical protein [Pseudomonas aeruginosa]